MAIDKEVEDFTDAIGAYEPQTGDEIYRTFRTIFKRRNYFFLEGNFIIGKISRTNPAWWGVRKDIIEAFNKWPTLENYFLVLLINGNEGWVYSKNEINRNIDDGIWKCGKDQNYKIYPAVIKDRNSFISPNQFLKKIGVEK